MYRVAMRPWFVALVVVALLVVPSLPASGGVVAADPAAVKLITSSFVGGFSAPVYATHAGDGSGRLFVVEQTARLRIIKNGARLDTPFLDLTSVVAVGGERGLFSVAFHPQYAANGYLYVNYTSKAVGGRQLGDLVLARYRVSTANPDIADPASEQIVLTIPHSGQTNHNGGTVAFGPDGYLYWSTGDGGGGGDTYNNGQRLVSDPADRNRDARLGKLLRLDVDGGSPYAIPPGNPFAGVGNTGADEIWAYGLRNPWRFAFDFGASPAMLYIGDVGQGLYEEVNAVPAASAGVNYGWKTREGAHCYNAPTCSTAGLTDPVWEYAHGTGDCSITGGFVYRGAKYPQMVGLYLYADYCTGRVWGLDRSGGTTRHALLLDTPYQVTSFGQGEDGELYLLHGGGTIYRLAALAANTLSAPGGLSSGGQTLTLTGTGFTTGTPVVRFGSIPAIATVVSDTALSVVVPAYPPPGGPVDVTVSLGGQTATLAGAYLYLAPNSAPPPRTANPEPGPPAPVPAAPRPISVPNAATPLPAPVRR